MKKYHTLLVVGIATLVVLLLTWILPITYFSSELVAGDRVRAGIFSVANYSLYTFYNFIYVFVHLLLIGGLYGLLNKTGAYRLLLDKVVKHVKERKVLSLSITVLLIAIIVSFTGFTYEALVVLPFIAAVVLLLGYDRITAAMVTVGSISVGIIGSTFAKAIAGKINTVLETPTYTDLIIPKVVVLILCSVVLVLNIIHHAKKNEVKENVEESFLVPKKVTSKTIKVWPLITIALVYIVVMVLAAIDWTGAFSVKFFSDALTTIKGWPVLSKYVILTVSVLVILINVLRSVIARKKNTKDAKKEKSEVKLLTGTRKIVTIVFIVIGFLALLKILLEDVFKATDFMTKALDAIKVNSFFEGFTFDKILGSVVAFGSYSYNDYMILLILFGLAIKFAYRIKFADAIDSVGEGFKKVLYACIVVLLSYTLLIMVSSHPIGLTILKPVLEATDGLNILLYPICTLFSALFNSDFAYYEYGVLNVSYVTTAYTGAGIVPLAEFITQTMYGFAMMLAPTSVILLFTLSLLDVKYTTWLKKTLLLLLELFVLLILAYVVLKLWII